MADKEIPDYRIGGGEPQRIWAVSADRIDAVLETTPAERRRRLRNLRELGLLVHQPGRLTAKVRVRPAVAGDSGIVRCYVFTVPPDELPRKRR